MVSVSKPEWLKVKIPAGMDLQAFREIEKTVSESGLHTVCHEAKCPNAFECWGNKTATFLILGGTCTRHCGYCNVKSGKSGEKIDESEAKKIAKAVKDWNLRYAVLTSVDRDDLQDFGSKHWRECIEEIKKECPETLVEVLIPDFQGKIECLEEVVMAKPKVIGHNIETVRELQEKARDNRADYETSLNVLKNVKKLDDGIFTKSSIMLGLGESKEQVLNAMKDLKNAKVDFLAIGQYLQPSKKNLPVERFVSLEEFEFYKKKGEELGFKFVASAPFVRTSYKAFEFFLEKK